MGIRTILLQGFITTFLFTSSAWAADARFCDQYARKSIQQQVVNVGQGCGNTGLRWSPLYEGQKNWCLTVRQAIAEAETQARETALRSCGTTSAPVNWRNLPDQPGVWDRLFAQEMTALKQDDAVSIEVMHRHGIDINHDEGFNNGTILYHAIAQQAEKSAHYLLRQGVNPNRTTNGGWNPLNNMFIRYDPQQRKYVSTKANPALLQLLLNYGADPNSYGELGPGSLPLDEAIDSNQLQAAVLLLRAGANPNLHDPGVDPILIRAITGKNHEAVVLLANSGANVNYGRGGMACKDKPDSDNILPLDIALKIGANMIAQVLRNQGARTAAECRG